MPVQLTADALRQIFPRAPQDILDAFLAKPSVLTACGVNQTRPRLTDFFANIDHECGGFTIPNLTENINYTAARMAQVWPNRFASAAAVAAKYGSAPGWQVKAIDDIYGGRMGNRPGTHDGSLYIGRGGPQWTGRDGYAELERRTSLPALAQPSVAARHDVQPEVCAAFWAWKNLNRFADSGNFTGMVKAWNGGTNGLADRQARAVRIAPIVAALPGGPDTPAPPKDAVNDATASARRTRTAAAAGAAAGAGNEGGKASGTVAPSSAPMPSHVAWIAVGVGLAVVIVATVIIAHRKAAVIRNWF